MYDNLAKVLRKSRSTLLEACKSLDIEPATVNVDKINLNCCDWCGFWDSKRIVLEEPDGSKYCTVCFELEYLTIK